MRRIEVIPLLLALVTGFPALGANPEVEAPRPLSAAEREAVALALDYLDGGPEAWLDRLDPEGPLGRLERDAALAEIGVRAGPPERAVWQLQTPGPGHPEERAIFSIEMPSGTGETLVLDLTRVQEDGGVVGWRIHRLHSLVDPWNEGGRLFDDDGEAGGDPGDGGDAAGAPPPFPPLPDAPLVAATLFALLLLAGLPLFANLPLSAALRRPVPRHRHPLRPAVAALGLTATLVALLLACGGSGDGPSAGETAGATDAPDMVRLGALEPLRRAVARGADREHIDSLARELGVEPAQGDGPAADDPRTDDPRTTAATLWLAELALNQTDLSEAEELLERLPARSPVPLGELLRARLAYVRGDPPAVSQAYDQAIAAGPNHDGIRLEAASALATLGLSNEAELGFDLLARMGSRLPDVFYGKAMFAVLLSKDERGEAYLRQAWEMQPAERADLLANPLLARLLARPSIFPIFRLTAPDEPVPELPPLDRRTPCHLPTGAEAWVSGAHLLVETAGDSRLEVPGGALLAPSTTHLLAPDDLRRRREEEVLARLPVLRAAAEDRSALAQPRRRMELVRAGVALARRNRWEDLEQLTSGLDGGELGPVPGELVQLRAAALLHLERNDEARALLIRLASSDLSNQRRDPGSLFQLAELMAAEEEYDLAVRLLRKASALAPHQASDLRIRQLTMQKRLAAAQAVWETDHFRVVYPRFTGERYARLLGIVLEEELIRLERWIPFPRGGEPIEVQLYPLEEFLRAYSSSAMVLGVYDGVVRVPFADLRSLHPELVSILSHELAHAMIGRSTDEQAPKWFHEGVAEHVQMSQDWINPYPDLHATSRVIAFPVLEPILRGFAEAQLIELAYGQSAWVAHYIEAEHGVRAMHRMLAAYRQGKTTPEALEGVFGMTPAEFDQAVRRWAVREAPGAWPTQVRRYDEELDLPFQRGAQRTDRPDLLSAEGKKPERSQRLQRTEGRRLRMERWHRLYAQRVAPFKRQLGALMNDLEAGRVAAHRQACLVLEMEIRDLLTERRLFATPAPAAGRHLRRALIQFQAMAQACAADNGGTARAHFRRAERELARAATELQPYGLQP